MDICVTSIVRNGMGYLDRYVAQVEALAREVEGRGAAFSLVMAEGDSTDGTDVWLNEYAKRAPFAVTVYHFPHGGPVFGSVNDKARWANIARTWNALYGQLGGGHVKPDDAVIYIEADLIWEPATMLALLAHVPGGRDAVSPMCFSSAHPTWFYDTWGHRGMAGDHFRNLPPPYHPSLEGWQPGTLVQISSAGSCMVMRGVVALRCHFSPTDAMLGHDIYRKGYELWLDPGQKVMHP